ncbi:hypothetical protein LBMAG42_39790 [Deltaproteobacteria bacterium]|nr:hypothetical protein LBMAG42_39790 [Deltaproteobacteria bacterium]
MIAFLFLVLACQTSTVAECAEDDPCEFGQECISGRCVAKTCATSDQCGIEEYCSADNTCTVGCQADTDCMYGDQCNVETNTCELAQCTDTHLDCGFNEFCSIQGDCYEAGGYFCRDCEDEGDCGGNGNKCFNGYCGVVCQTDSDCPGGFACIQPYEDTFVCYATCYLYEDK